MTPLERFNSKIAVSERCWLWTGSTFRRGYGKFALTHRKTVQAHRYSYEVYKGPIPEGLTIDHICRVTGCVKPSHLEAVSIKENIHRGFGHAGNNKRKTHCVNGHEFTEGNTWKSKKSGRRQCKTCLAARQVPHTAAYYREWRARRKVMQGGKQAA